MGGCRGREERWIQLSLCHSSFLKNALKKVSEMLLLMHDKTLCLSVVD